MIQVNNVAQEHPRKRQASKEFTCLNLEEKLAVKIEYLERENKERKNIIENMNEEVEKKARTDNVVISDIKGKTKSFQNSELRQKDVNVL